MEAFQSVGRSASKSEGSEVGGGVGEGERERDGEGVVAGARSVRG